MERQLADISDDSDTDEENDNGDKLTPLIGGKKAGAEPSISNNDGGDTVGVDHPHGRRSWHQCSKTAR